MKISKGFTLIELLVVVAIIAILAVVVLVAVNPGQQLANSRNARRWAEVNALLSAFSQYQIDNGGAVPGPCEVTSATSVACAQDEINPGYIAAIPVDPSGGACTYEVAVTTTTVPYRVTVSAPCAEDGATISVTR
jgi:general secretion pathway protein G